MYAVHGNVEQEGAEGVGDGVIAEQKDYEDQMDDDQCQQCHQEPRDREDSPACLNCRIVAREYEQERRDDR